MRSGRLARRLLILASMSLLSMMFSGCISVEFRSEFFRDGSAQHVLAVVFPRDVFDAAESAGEVAVVGEIALNAAAAGLQTNRIDAEDTVTLQVRLERADGEDAGADLNSLLNATGINPSPGVIAPFRGSFRQESAAVGGSTFTLNLEIEGALLYDAIAAMDAAQGTPRETIEAEIDIEYLALVPGNLGTTTGTEIGDDLLQWDVHSEEVTLAQVETSAGDTGTAALFIIAAIASVVGAIVLAAIIGWMLVRRPRLSRAIGSAATHFPRRTTITREGVWVVQRIRQYVEHLWHRGATDGQPPLRNELLQHEQEGEDDGADAEGNRPATGIHGS